MKFLKPFQVYTKRIKDQVFSYIVGIIATNVDESYIHKMLNELFPQKVIVNNPTSCGHSFFIVEKEKKNTKKSEMT